MGRGNQPDITLRSWSDKDLPLLERLMGDPSMTEHLGGPETPEKISERHKRYCQSSASGKDPMFAIVLGYEDTAVGSIGYWEKDWHGMLVWETGWSVLPEFQGHGIATRATKLVIGRARAENKHRFLHAFPSTDNEASNAVCRKAGFTFDKDLNFEYPSGNLLRCNDWYFDLFAKLSGTEEI
jgi:RimJ/RimL family protein N-acetyltransferase